MSKEKDKPKDNTRYLDRPEENKAFQESLEYINQSLTPLEFQTLRLMILDLKRQVPTWNFSTALVCLSIAQNTVALDQIRQKAAEKNTGMTRNFTEQMSDLMNQIDKLKKQIGVDPKASSGEGSMSETFADIAKRTKFDTRRFVCKNILGQVRREIDGESSDDFSGVSEENVQTYLEKAVTD